MADTTKISGNGHGRWSIDTATWPHYLQFVWVVLNKLGLGTLLILVGAAFWGNYQMRISTPEAEARLALLKQVADCMNQIVASEQAQITWQIEWKAYISDQHKQRCAEAKAITEHQMRAEAFFDRTDRLHSQQLDFLQGVMEELRAIRLGLLKNGEPLPATKPGGESKN